ncbi:MAG: cytochrome c biogenesis protein CcsA [Candidatus Hinthialibacter antarcticus]|nr:cytochrome c biogenesis protein CcsA [Candidatus Hinthialibacter antarcticus]
MRSIQFWIAAFVLICTAPISFSQVEFNFEPLNSIPVQEDGRVKPLQTFSGESVKDITGRWKFQSREPVNTLLLFLSSHDWSDAEIVKLGYIPLKKALGVDLNQERFSVNGLINNASFQAVAEDVRNKQMAGTKLNKLENETGRLMHQLITYQILVSGEALTMVPPPPGSPEVAKWLSIVQPTGYPAETQAKIKDTFSDVITAFHHGNASEFEQSSISLHTLLAQLNTDPLIYPTAALMEREIYYNESRPFLNAWIIYMLAFFGFLLSFFFVKARWLYWTSMAFAFGGFAFHGWGLLLRALIAGRPPVSNMYETVVFVGWGVLLFALIFELIYRRRWYAAVGTFCGVGFLILADILPFDPNIEPLVPVLRSNYWLIIHVLTITISYSAFALAMGLAHVSLFVYFYCPNNKMLLRELSLFLYRVLQVGVVLLAIGTILGGVWAAESWGRFWGWDPKETWALISLLGYLAILHARYTGWIHDFGTAIGSILGFFLILMTWYGVNFVLGTGLHSYGFGAGGGEYVIAYLVAEFIFMGVVSIKYLMMRSTMPIEENVDDGISAA